MIHNHPMCLSDPVLPLNRLNQVIVRSGLRAIRLLILLIAFALPATATGVADPAPDLPGLVDPSLQSALERVVRDLGLWRYVENGRLAVGLLDLSNPDLPHLATLNPHRMLYAASLPKIAILFGAYALAADGELELDDDLRRDIRRMIRYSDNASATRVLTAVGRERLIDLLMSKRYRFYDREGTGGLWVGKDYAPRPAYRRDPLHHLSHGATVYQVLRFFYLLESGKLVPSPMREEMLAVLSNPGIHHKFVAGLQQRAISGIYRKSGTWRDHHADAAMVDSAGHRFVMVAIARHAKGGEWITRLAAPLHDLIAPEASTEASTKD